MFGIGIPELIISLVPIALVVLIVWRLLKSRSNTKRK